MSSSREGMKARSGIHARLRARHRKQEAVDEKRHQCMKLNIQAVGNHTVLVLIISFQTLSRRHLISRELVALNCDRGSSFRLDFRATRTTTRTPHTHEHTRSLNFRRTAWRQPRTLRCSLDPFLSCHLTRRPLRSLNFCNIL